MKKAAVILILSLLSLGNVKAMNDEHGGRGSHGGGGFRGGCHGGFHENYHRGFYGNGGYRGGFYGARVYVPVWVSGYWIYDNYGNQIQWVNGYYR